MAISHFGTGAKSAGGTTTVSVGRPGGESAGDLTICGRVGWLDTITFTNESGWTNGGSLSGGINSANDDHTTAVRADYQEIVGGEGTPVVFDQGGTISGCVGNMVSYRKTGGAWETPVVRSGNDNTHAGNRSIASSATMPLQPGDMLVAIVAYDTDAFAASPTYAFSASGITFGTLTRRTGDAGVTTGSDGNIQICDALVSSGSGDVTVTLTITQVTAQCGPALFVRLREIIKASPFRRRRQPYQRGLITR